MRRGTTSVVADLLAYETENNPDADVQYGFEEISDECAASLPPDIGPPTYTGIVDSHAYAVAEGAHKWYVADAGGNDIIAVSSKGEVSTVAVLPPQPFVITAETAGVVGFPECTVGLTYNFEPVPTDVEVSNSGLLYVTTLPGGPEDPSLGARGSVYAVDPSNGEVTHVASGLARSDQPGARQARRDLRRRAVRWTGVADRRRGAADRGRASPAGRARVGQRQAVRQLRRVRPEWQGGNDQPLRAQCSQDLRPRESVT